MRTPKYSPESDGVDHINISYLARTQLGRQLNDSVECPIEWTTGTGKVLVFKTAFNGLAWLLLGSCNDDIVDVPVDEVRRRLSTSKVRWNRYVIEQWRQMLISKISNWPALKTGFSDNTLPYASYVRNRDDTGWTARRSDAVTVKVLNQYREAI